jgi:hypothetical protein
MAGTRTEPSTDTGPVADLQVGDGDHERFAHYVRREDQMKGYVLGEPVTALCGKTWVPNRDPKRFPVCPDCEAIRKQLLGR